MAARYTDDEIAALLAEPKPLGVDFRQRLRLREKRGPREAELGITGTAGSQFWILGRQASFNALDFSIILAVTPTGSNLRFRLRRHSGRSHEHAGQTARSSFYDFHIRMATLRHQELGMKEDAFAERTDRYGDYGGALRCLFSDCGIVFPTEEGGLFSGVGA